MLARPNTPQYRTRALSPFDSLICFRDRTHRMFEVYTPAPQRVYGHYVLPFLLGDLEADRAVSTLRVQSAHLEPHAKVTKVVGPRMRELRDVAAWLGLEMVVVEKRGDLAPKLARAK